MYVLSSTPFHLRPSAESEIGLWASRSRRYDVSGIARLDGRQLVLEWNGRTRVSEVGMTTSRRYEEEFPAGTCVLPLGEIASVELRGRWWRPRLEIITTSLSSVAAIPGGRAGRVVLWLSRQDWSLAQNLRSELRLAMAELALQAAERVAELPAPGADWSDP